MITDKPRRRLSPAAQVEYMIDRRGASDGSDTPHLALT